METGNHIFAGFQVHLNMIMLQGDTSATSSNVREATSKRQQIINRVLQPDIVTHLRTCLDAYKHKNNLAGGQVCLLMNNL